MVKYAGMDPSKDVTFISVGSVPTAIPAFLTRQIDALMAFEPMTTKLLGDQSATMVIDLTKPQTQPFLKLFDWNYDNWSALRSNVVAKREAFTRFQSAMKDTFAWMAEPANFAQAADIGVKELGLDRNVVELMLRNNLSSLGFFYQKSKVDSVVNYLTVTGLLKTAPKLPLTFEDYVLPEVRGK
jgi:NitT/TauT family transport system substrate-binding protein